MERILSLDLAIYFMIAFLVDWSTHMPIGYIWEGGYKGWAFDLWQVEGGGYNTKMASCKRGIGYNTKTFEMEGSHIAQQLTQIVEDVCDVRTKVINYGEDSQTCMQYLAYKL